MSGEWLDGPKLVAWLRKNDCKLTEPYIGYHARAARHWREGAAVSVYEADKVLTKLALHLELVPEDVWRGPPTRSGRPRKVTA